MSRGINFDQKFFNFTRLGLRGDPDLWILLHTESGSTMVCPESRLNCIPKNHPSPIDNFFLVYTSTVHIRLLFTFGFNFYYFIFLIFLDLKQSKISCFLPKDLFSFKPAQHVLSYHLT